MNKSDCSLANHKLPTSMEIKNLNIELSNTNGIFGNGKTENFILNFDCPYNAAFPNSGPLPDYVQAEANLEKDLKAFGFFSGEGIEISIERFRKINIPAWVWYGQGMDPLTPQGHLMMLVISLAWFFDDVVEDGYTIGNRILFQFIKGLTDANKQKHTIVDYTDCVGDEAKDKNGNDCFESIVDFLTKLQMLKLKIIRDLTEIFPAKETENFMDSIIHVERTWYLCFLYTNNLNPENKIGLSMTTKIFQRRISVGVSMAMEYIAALNGIILEDFIRDDPMFKRLLETLDTYSHYLNDLIGCVKDFKNKDYDSALLIYYDAFNDISKAMEKMVQVLREAYQDYFIIRGQLMDIYPESRNLQSYLEWTDKTLGGQIAFHVESPRYGIHKYWVTEKLFKNKDKLSFIRHSLDKIANEINSIGLKNKYNKACSMYNKAFKCIFYGTLKMKDRKTNKV